MQFGDSAGADSTNDAFASAYTGGGGDMMGGGMGGDMMDYS